MSSGRREDGSVGRRINLFKIIIVVILIAIVIALIYFKLIKKNNNNEEEYTTIDESALLIENEEEEEEEKTLEQIVQEFGGEITENIKYDTCYASKDGKDYTVYLDGDIVEGKIPLWDGTAVEPSVDEAGNYNIYNAQELKWIADRIITGEKNFGGVTITLRNNIDLGARKNEENEDVWDGNTWTSIIGFLDEIESQNPEENANTEQATNTDAQPVQEQNPVAEETPTDTNVEITQENLKRFAGIFNGNNLWIRGLYINSDKRYQGLFGYQTGTIQNLTIKNSYIKGTNGTGAFAGLNGGTLVSCSLDNVKVEGTEKVGGFVGINMSGSWIENCTEEKSNSIISGKKFVGGIAGYMNNNAAIISCSNLADVLGNEYIGGIVGISFYGTQIKSSSNFASNTVGENYVGGLVGYSQSDIENSYNHNNENKVGIVSGKDYVGGLVGLNYLMGNITNSFNYCDVIAENENLGGIVGLNNANVSSCYNIGKVSAGENAGNKIGGICGQNLSDSFIYTSYNVGSIDAKNAGGIVGADFGTISNSFYLNTSITNAEENESSKDENQMKTEIITELGDEYKEDTENKNNGYPILGWQ